MNELALKRRRGKMSEELAFAGMIGVPCSWDRAWHPGQEMYKIAAEASDFSTYSSYENRDETPWVCESAAYL